ncbi:hypothetical protein NPIL_243251 [Nephila pilipes]|uniref:Uncharacterized protein n=1 Tax=Nephila pilipes TaxID=299642 RepID=A0A8X6TFL0_NEPPI|nr:hypothetical protein NPIL_243251 [Nephila pilipes]
MTHLMSGESYVVEMKHSPQIPWIRKTLNSRRPETMGRKSPQVACEHQEDAFLFVSLKQEELAEYLVCSYEGGSRRGDAKGKY